MLCSVCQKECVDTCDIMEERKEAEENEFTRETITIKQAVDRLKKACEEEPDYAYGWHSNIAVAVMDSINEKENELLQKQGNDSHTIGNEAATRFMYNLFGVHTSATMMLDDN